MERRIVDDKTGKQYLVRGPIHENKATGIWCGKAYDNEWGTCFVKIATCLSGKDFARMKDEARCIALTEKCSHRVPKLYAHWPDSKNKQYILVMQWMEGETLRSWMVNHSPKQWTKRSLRERMDIVSQICSIMESIARDRQCQALVHRDLKPENIMVRHKGEKLEISIIDFGCAPLSYVRNVGTAGYQAPEQTGNYRDYPTRITQKTDIFAIGQIFYELLSGQLPRIGIDYVRRTGKFEWETNPSFPNDVKSLLSDNKLEDLLKQMTAFKPENRIGYSSIITELRRVRFANPSMAQP